MLCLIILSTSGGRFLRSFSWEFYLLSEFLPEICWEVFAEEIHTYIIGHYKPSVRITLCVLTLYISGGAYSLKSTPNIQIFDELFMAILFTLRVFARNLLRGSCRTNIFIFSYWWLTWGLNSGPTSKKLTHCLLHYGAEEIFIYISFFTDAWPGVYTAASCLIIQHTNC